MDPDLGIYDRFLVFMSGGKDSLACILRLLDLGVPASKIELHHHLVDGVEGSKLMDWPVTNAYSRAVADALGMEYRTSWREGGFEREMLRQDAPTAPVWIPDDNGGHRRVGGNGPLGTRLKFPQVSANLSVRWCSSALKIDVGARYLTNHPKFTHGKTLVLTGERAQESTARSRYASFEPHRSDLRSGRKYQRHIDHWRPLHQWSEQQVWAIIERHRVLPHPAYYLGWGRTSCRQCIFGSKDQWATVKAIAPRNLAVIANHERTFGVTIHRKDDVLTLARKGTPYTTNPYWVDIANSESFDLPVIVENWVLPQGAYGESCGPT
ncbi:phosphoadenosine phosphosulfate reductase domain-containing protein [Hydrogenophaga sp. NFH-34]|uniref:phosphoadenosine phosphosulfate reductase domain-containing protein n=1 Tax=Hydrogenophaga sp. NFH-34 TaxID=2744446 RepID=UPI001F357D46|nr:phosphoadenosine phosphosulfate reductase family protein [Hydrogenophaga sp. NFH-34]